MSQLTHTAAAHIAALTQMPYSNAESHARQMNDVELEAVLALETGNDIMAHVYDVSHRIAAETREVEHAPTSVIEIPAQSAEATPAAEPETTPAVAAEADPTAADPTPEDTDAEETDAEETADLTDTLADVSMDDDTPATDTEPTPDPAPAPKRRTRKS
jgi:hypothetical protein